VMPPCTERPQAMVARLSITVLLEAQIVSLRPTEAMPRCAIGGSDTLPPASTHPCRPQSPSGA
jgi:hypothetical protein